VLFCGGAGSLNDYRLLGREWWSAPREAYRARLSYHLEIAPAFLNTVIDHACRTRLSPVLVHSHPRAPRAEYSPSDDFGESRLLPVLAQLLPDRTPASLLVTPTELRGRRLAGGCFMPMDRVSVVGPAIEVYPGAHDGRGSSIDDDYEMTEFDRQVRAIGIGGQRSIAGLRVAVVGLGGTGSAVAEQIVRLGVLDLLLVDPDTIERTNLSRVWGSHASDVEGQRKKVEVIAKHLHGISPSLTIVTLPESVVRQPVLQNLRDRDLVFACTDNHWSRSVLNRFAHQYLIPVVDMGVRMDARTGQVTGAAGQVSLVGEGLSCLRCSRLVDPDRVRAESMPETERQPLIREGYVQGHADPQPSIISLNTTVAGMAVTAGVSLFTKLLGGPPPLQLRYDAQRGSVFAVDPRHDPGCDVCSDTDGVKGLGDLQPVTAYE
jgi:molybdopterin/thiamine biosynthesis adenylyltransferase